MKSDNPRTRAPQGAPAGAVEQRQQVQLHQAVRQRIKKLARRRGRRRPRAVEAEAPGGGPRVGVDAHSTAGVMVVSPACCVTKGGCGGGFGFVVVGWVGAALPGARSARGMRDERAAAAAAQYCDAFVLPCFYTRRIQQLKLMDACAGPITPETCRPGVRARPPSPCSALRPNPAPLASTTNNAPLGV
jgi:hypothetical protein